MIPTGPLVGAGLAMASALAFAFQYLCIRVGTDKGSVADAMLVTLACNVAIVVPVVAVIYRDAPGELFTPLSVLAFAGAGVVGVWIARVCMFTSVKRIGANRTSPLVASNALFATVFAYLLLGERVGPGQLLGIVLVVGGVAGLSMLTADGTGQSWREVGTELVYPITAAALIGIEPIFITVGLGEGTPVLAGLAVMMVAGFISFVVHRRITQGGLALTRSRSTLRWHLAAGVAATVAFVGYILALEATSVVVVMPIIQTNVLLVIGLSAVFLPSRLERVSWRLVGAALVIVVGVVLVSVTG